MTAAARAAGPPPQPNAAQIQLGLAKLGVAGSVLYVAAHPDDENTALLAYLANGALVRAGYLSLTRGDGGQNLVGAEQGPELGLIRTQELLAARRIDGAEQFFTRARDFGYSKTPDETLRIWGKDAILADVVWVIRRFRPDLIITRFSPEPSDTHGHHTASAMLALEAFHAAADPRFHPEQLAGGVSTWQARRILWNRSNWNMKPGEDLSGFEKLDVGGFNPLLGESYGEIAADSRSMHKSQGFGVARSRGPTSSTSRRSPRPMRRRARAKARRLARGQVAARRVRFLARPLEHHRAPARRDRTRAEAVRPGAPGGGDPGAARGRRRARRPARRRLARAQAARGARSDRGLRRPLRRRDRRRLQRRARRFDRGHRDAGQPPVGAVHAARGPLSRRRQRASLSGATCTPTPPRSRRRWSSSTRSRSRPTRR